MEYTRRTIPYPSLALVSQPLGSQTPSPFFGAVYPTEDFEFYTTWRHWEIVDEVLDSTLLSVINKHTFHIVLYDL
jgi:hypothetical protein